LVLPITSKWSPFVYEKMPVAVEFTYLYYWADAKASPRPTNIKSKLLAYLWEEIPSPAKAGMGDGEVCGVAEGLTL
jgi:hypothetical protein